MKIVSLGLIALSTALISGCGSNIVNKTESSEAPTAVKAVSVVVDRSSIGKYTVTKTITSSSKEKAEIPAADKAVAQAYVSQVADELPASVESGISKQLQERGVISGKDYRLVVALNTVQFRFNESLIIPSVVDITYSATLLRLSDMKPLWKASFRRPNGSTSLTSAKNLGEEVSQKIFSELASSGWIPKN